MASINYNQIQTWLFSLDPGAMTPGELTGAYTRLLLQAGFSFVRLSGWLPTTHPELWGYQVIWRKGGEVEVLERHHGIENTAEMIDTPAEAIYEHNRTLHWSLEGRPEELPYDLLRTFREQGGTGYLIVPVAFTGRIKENRTEVPWIAYCTDRPGGFSRRERYKLQQYTTLFGMHMRTVIAEESKRSLLKVYLGKDAAGRVLDGHFYRGSGSGIDCAVWFCDLRGFTDMSSRAGDEELVRLLDRFFEIMAGSIEDHGGEILKFIGDAVLAIFRFENGGPQEACRRARSAATEALAALDARNRENGGQLHTGIALHCGRVMYGNIGGRSRLDFTVIGSVVNEASRIESLCKPLKARLLMSEEFTRHLDDHSTVSLGTFELRGVPKPRQIFSQPGCYEE